MAHKRTVLERAFKIITMFQAGRKLTCKDVEDSLEITRHSAQNYIDAASAVLPIYESGKRPGLHGRAATVYEVIK